jgi:plasmid stabilization system protein ParE
MRLTVEIHAEAERELEESTARIAADSPIAAERFVDAVRRDLEIVLTYPRSGKQVRRSRVREFVIDGWRHSIVYALEDSKLVVFAFAHQSRRPRYWSKRVSG